MQAVKEVSVLMPAYNCAEYISHSIKSILGQTHKDYEFIIVNDGSTDKTEDIILGFSDPRIKYFKTINKGTSAALNFGVTKAQHKWIARIDADDLNTPARLEKQIAFINENPDIDVISTWAVYFDNKGKILFTFRPYTRHKDIVKELNLHNPLNQSGLMIKKSILKKDKFNEKFIYNEDFELLHRIKDRVKFQILPEFMVYTRFVEGTKSWGVKRRNAYDFLFTPAFKNLMDSKSKGDHFYWASVLAWINFFYGDRKDSRSYFKRSVSLKNTIAYLATFLPEKLFERLIEMRLRYRISTLFRKKTNLKNELRSLTR